jgi:hypothetical protein
MTAETRVYKRIEPVKRGYRQVGNSPKSHRATSRRLRSVAGGSATTASTSGLSFLSIHDLEQSELRDFLVYKGG